MNESCFCIHRYFSDGAVVLDCSRDVHPPAFCQSELRNEMRHWGQLLLLTHLSARSHARYLPVTLSWSSHYISERKPEQTQWISCFKFYLLKHKYQWKYTCIPCAVVNLYRESWFLRECLTIITDVLCLILSVWNSIFYLIQGKAYSVNY